jgi:hypothetical protein
MKRTSCQVIASSLAAMVRTTSIRNILLLMLVTVMNSCSHKNPHLYKKYYGIYIDHSLRQGSGYSDSTGVKYWYFYVKTVITNDSLVPAHVRLNIPNEYYQTNFSDSEKYKVFLLPDSMTEQNEFKDYYLVSGELKKFFDSGIEKPFTLDTVLKPKEDCTVYIGFITKVSNGMNPYLSLFSRGDKPHFWPSEVKSKMVPSDSLLSIPDTAINKFILSPEKQLSLFLGITMINFRINEPAKYYNIIPCGQVSYSD